MTSLRSSRLRVAAASSLVLSIWACGSEAPLLEEDDSDQVTREPPSNDTRRSSSSGGVSGTSSGEVGGTSSGSPSGSSSGGGGGSSSGEASSSGGSSSGEASSSGGSSSGEVSSSGGSSSGGSSCQWPAEIPKVVISQIYGGGGNTNATWKSDFVELYNRSDAEVSLTDWSVQYASAAGNFPAMEAGQNGLMPLSGTIPAHSYYLVRAADGAGNSPALPAADVVATGAKMGANHGKVVLVRNATALGTVTNANLADAQFRADKQIEDLVGYGTSASTYEGAGTTPVLSAILSARRKGSCVDTDDNKADFEAVTPTPRNKSQTGPACECPVDE